MDPNGLLIYNVHLMELHLNKYSEYDYDYTENIQVIFQYYSTESVEINRARLDVNK